MQTLSYRFEELADFWDGPFRSGAHNGIAEISFAHTGEWYVSAVSLECHNGQVGAKAAGVFIPLAYHEVIREKLISALEHFSRDHIQDAVNAELVSMMETA